MKLKRIIKAAIIITIACIFIFGIMPAMILPKLNIGSDAGYWGTTVPVSEIRCTCYGIKYNPEGNMLGAQHLKCFGYRPIDSCKPIKISDSDFQNYIERIKNNAPR